MSNPFTLMFGKEPALTIRRDGILNEVVTDFQSELPTSQLYILIGARGAGKSVLLSEFYRYFDQEDDWVVADVNPHRDIREDLAAAIYDHGRVKHLFLKDGFDFSFQGLSFHLEGKEPLSSISSVLERMLAYLKKRNKKVLITLDEVSSTPRMKEFAHDYQSFVRKDYPVYLLMTGLYENVMTLQNDKSLTFLYRAPRKLLKPLDHEAVSFSYQKALNLSEEEADRLASLSGGYGFGYQLLGHLYYEHPSIDEDLLEQYDYQLSVNAYDKIWSSLGEKERQILRLIRGGEQSTSALPERIGVSPKAFSVYRERLLNKGLVLDPKRGVLTMALPRFDVFMDKEGISEI